MSNRSLIIALWVTVTVTIAGVVLSYVFKFGNQSISTDTAVWGQFGDYIGGLLNPIIALLNLIVLAYLSINVIRVEDERNQSTLQELARPLGDIHTTRQPNGLEIILKNCGLGPMKIRNVKILYEEKEYSSYKDIFPEVPNTFSGDWEYWYISDDEEGIIPKDQQEFLVRIETNNSIRPEFIKEIYEILYKTKISVSYVDIYDRQMPIIIKDYSKTPDKNI